RLKPALVGPPARLRAAGLSGRKGVSMGVLAAKVVNGTVPLHRIGRLADEEVITRLSVVPGIGRWTAEMFLIFQLGRLDVWPVGDLGVRKGYATAWGLAEMPTPKELTAYGETFRPYRSVAAWYCWRAVDSVVQDSSADTAAAAPPPHPATPPRPAAAPPPRPGAAKTRPAKRPSAPRR